MESMMNPQSTGPAFFFYSPDPNLEGRQHGRFIPQQQPTIHPMTMLPIVPTLPSTPAYSRPGSSSCSQPPLLPKGFTTTPILPSSLTPAASPSPIAQKPMIVLDTELGEVDELYSPSTPPLSTSGSVISSPGSCDKLQTPLNPMFSGLDGVDGKQTSDLDGELESFPTLDWSACASPPLTPVFLQPQPQAPKIAPLNTEHSTDLLSPASSCPSLSPSPSPYARSVSSDDFDFCDPRNLTVGTVNSTLAPEFSALPTLCAGEDEDQKFVLRGAAPTISPSSSFEFTSESSNNVPSFDDFSDLDSDDDFVNGLVNLGDCSVNQISRSRASSDALSLGQSDEFGLGSFGAGSLVNQPQSRQDSDAHKDKRQKKSKDTSKPIMSTLADSQSGTAHHQPAPSNQDSGSSSSGSSTAPEVNHASEPNSGSDNTATTPAQAPPTSRRGRKQSLTEDPSKTFVCDICNRRFRRQEHLKRHYRSLHTQEKPFECSDCGKKFSRSDNLAQHARTHGAGAIVMNLIDDPDAMAAAAALPPGYPHSAMMGTPGLVGGEEYHSLGKVLFQVSADVPGSASEISSDEGSEQGKKKRKRAD
ncbi:hypothetical protein VTK26DRAFT_8721 [Humicola hyalothermophila]